MGTVSTLNAGLTDLLQTLSNVNSPILSSKNAMAALESAPVSDIVQLSTAALQLEGVNAIFGVSSTSNTDMSSLFASLENPTGTSSTSSLLANASPSDQAANYESELQGELTQGLFGAGSGSLPGSLFSTVG